MSALETLRRGVAEKSLIRYKRQTVDLFSASAIVQVYDALNEQNKARYEALMEKSILKAAEIAFKVGRKK